MYNMVLLFTDDLLLPFVKIVRPFEGQYVSTLLQIKKNISCHLEFILG